MDGDDGVDEMGVNYNAPLSPEEAVQEAIAAIDAKGKETSRKVI